MFCSTSSKVLPNKDMGIFFIVWLFVLHCSVRISDVHVVHNLSVLPEISITSVWTSSWCLGVLSKPRYSRLMYNSSVALRVNVHACSCLYEPCNGLVICLGCNPSLCWWHLERLQHNPLTLNRTNDKCK